MKALIRQVQRFWKDEKGATAVEYGVMVALIAATIIGTVTTLGKNLDSQFSSVATKVAPAAPPAN